MGQEYIVSCDNVTLSTTGIGTLVGINPVAGAATAAGFEVIRAWISQRASTTSAQLGCVMGHKQATFPTFAVAAGPASIKFGSPASKIAGSTAGTAGLSGANSSTADTANFTTIYPDNFNCLNGWLWVPTPAETFQYMPGGTSAFRLGWLAAPATSTGWTAGVVFREIG